MARAQTVLDVNLLAEGRGAHMSVTDPVIRADDAYIAYTVDWVYVASHDAYMRGVRPVVRGRGAAVTIRMWLSRGICEMATRFVRDMARCRDGGEFGCESCTHVDVERGGVVVTFAYAFSVSVSVTWCGSCRPCSRLHRLCERGATRRAPPPTAAAARLRGLRGQLHFHVAAQVLRRLARSGMS